MRIIFTPQVTAGRICQCTNGKTTKQTEKDNAKNQTKTQTTTTKPKIKLTKKFNLSFYLKLWCSSRFGDEETPWFIVPIIYGLKKNVDILKAKRINILNCLRKPFR